VAIWLRDNPLSQYIRREVFLDVSFTAASFRTLDSISGGSQTFDLTALTVGFQPVGASQFPPNPTLKIESPQWSSPIQPQHAVP
jgi:hypothetical protein